MESGPQNNLRAAAFRAVRSAYNRNSSAMMFFCRFLWKQCKPFIPDEFPPGRIPLTAVYLQFFQVVNNRPHRILACGPLIPAHETKPARQYLFLQTPDPACLLPQMPSVLSDTAPLRSSCLFACY